jgi:choline dehydrogenase-like flavoprotein
MSVVDADQRSWDHHNLYLVGGGSLPTIGTSNVTLTVAALCLRSARAMIAQLDAERAPIEIAQLQEVGG